MTQSTVTDLGAIAKQSAGMIVAIGVLLVIIGAGAVAAPLAAGISIAVAVGILLIVGGIGQLFYGFKAGSFGASLLLLLGGGLKTLIGVLTVTHPVLGLLSLTLLLAFYFLVEGVFEIVWSFQLKPAVGWGWAFASGVTSLLLGLMMWAEFPLSGVWAVGLLVGFKLIFSGSSLIAIGRGVRGAAKEASAT